jgi:hypothetical protein
MFSVLFVCICVLYYCHRLATQLQLNISYHMISYHIISTRWWTFGSCRMHRLAVKLSGFQEGHYSMDAIFFVFVCSWLCPCRLRTSAFFECGPPTCLPRPYLRAPSGHHRTRLPVLAGQHPDASCCPQANSSFCSQQATTLRLPLIRSFAVESQKLTLRGLLY